MRCEGCGAEGKGPRFLKRHLHPDSVCARKIKEVEARKRYTARLAECRTLDFEEFDGGEGDEEHYLAVANLPVAYTWIGHEGKNVDLRHIDLKYAENLVRWMDLHNCHSTPYQILGQYDYLKRRLAWLTLAKNALSSK